MSLLKKSIFAGLCAFLFLAGGVYVVFSTILMSGFQAVEDDAARRDLNRAKIAVMDRAEDLVSSLADWSVWDDAYNFIQSPTQGFIESNLEPASFRVLDINFLIFVNTRGEIVWSKGYDLETLREKRIPERLIKELKGDAKLGTHKDIDSIHSGILQTPDGTLLVASLPSLTSQRKGPIKGAIVGARVLNAAVLAEISEKLNLELSLTPTDSPHLKELSLQEIDRTLILGSATIPDLTGKSAHRLDVRLPRPIYSQALSTRSSLSAAMSLAVGIVVVLWLLFVRTTILSRLTRLSKDLRRITTSADKKLRVMVRGRDEIAVVAEDINLMLTAIDSTTQQVRDLERQLSHARKMEAIGKLAGGIAHDFNNILSAVHGFTTLAQREIPADSKTWDNLKEVITACNRAKVLIQRIMTFSRATEKKRQPVRLKLLVEEALRLISPSLPATIELRKVFEDGDSTIIGDPAQLHQVLINLCVNAVDAMKGKGGTLSVSLTFPGCDGTMLGSKKGSSAGTVRLSISDSGIGIPPSILPKIFDPFFTTKENGEGTGMGLSIVHGIVKDHGGDISVETAIHNGTTFEITLPLARASAADEAQHEGSWEKVDSTETHILFVDDEEPLVRLARQMIEEFGYSVTAVSDASKALSLIQQDPNRFDLIITDQQMPKVTGEMILKATKKMRPNLPVIVLTGYSEDFSEDRAYSAGCDKFLMKPVAPESLRRAIAAALKKGLESTVR